MIRAAFGRRVSGSVVAISILQVVLVLVIAALILFSGGFTPGRPPDSPG